MTNAIFEDEHHGNGPSTYACKYSSLILFTLCNNLSIVPYNNETINCLISFNNKMLCDL